MRRFSHFAAHCSLALLVTAGATLYSFWMGASFVGGPLQHGTRMECRGRVGREQQDFQVSNHWVSLLEEPHLWGDCRGHKARGDASPKFPDFKRLDGSASLWLNDYSIQEDILAKIQEGLELAEYPWAQGQRTSRRDTEAQWRSVFENPEQWLDCRAAKQEGRVKESFPDFRHVDGDMALWVNSKYSPDGLQEDLESQAGAWPLFQGGQRQSDGVGRRTSRGDTEAQWRSVFENPEQWLDCRAAKQEGRVKESFPDFRHVDGDVALWVNSKYSPDGLQEELESQAGAWPLFQGGQRQSHGVGRRVETCWRRASSRTLSSGVTAARPRRKGAMKLSPSKALWRSVFQNPEEWRDYRRLKAVGLTSPDHPDFKNVMGDGSLWVDTWGVSESVREKLQDYEWMEG